MIRYLAVFFFLHNSSIGLTHWCAHQSGPIRPIRSRVGAVFPFPFPSDSSTNLCLFCLFPCVLPYFAPFLASFFLCQCTTFPHVTTVHSCSTLLLSARNSLPCVSTVQAGKSIYCTVPLLIFLFLLSVSSNLLTSLLLVLHRLLRRSPSFPIVSMSTSGHPVEVIIIQSIALRFTSSYVADPSPSSCTSCCSIGLGCMSYTSCNFNSLSYIFVPVLPAYEERCSRLMFLLEECPVTSS